MKVVDNCAEMTDLSTTKQYQLSTQYITFRDLRIKTYSLVAWFLLPVDRGDSQARTSRKPTLI